MPSYDWYTRYYVGCTRQRLVRATMGIFLSLPVRILTQVGNAWNVGTSVVDPKLFFSDPDPTFQEISDPDPAPDPANNFGSDRIRIHNTGGTVGTGTWYMATSPS